MRNVLRASIDAHVYENSINTNYGSERFLALREDSPQRRYAYIFFGRPFPIGAYVLSAKLKIRLWDGWGGSSTIRARRITQNWKESRITWANAPSVTTTSEATKAVSGGANGDIVEIDVTTMMRDIQPAGVPWYGIRLDLTAGNATRKRIYSAEAFGTETGPKLDVLWTVSPSAPTDLHPSGARYVSGPKPILDWTFRDADGTSDQVQAHIQVDDASDFATPVHNSGQIALTDTQYDLGPTAWAGATADVLYYWRVKVVDGNGLSSPWSDTATWKYISKGALSVTGPSGTQATTTPVITHTFTGRTQAAVQYLLYENGALIWDSGRVATSATSREIPAGLVKLETANAYRVVVRVWDTIDRDATPGDPAYVEGEITFGMGRDGTVAATNTLTLQRDHAVMKLLVSRTAQPDFFEVRVDGKTQHDRLTASEYSVGGTNYVIPYHKARPNTNHNYEVIAVVGGKRSNSNPVATGATLPAGIWLLQRDGDYRVALVGDTSKDLAIAEESETFYPVNRRDPVRVTQSVRGYEGSVGGTITDMAGMTAEQQRDNLEKMKAGLGSEEIRLVVGDINIPVGLGEVSITPDGRGNFDASVEVYQVGEFAFTPTG